MNKDFGGMPVTMPRLTSRLSVRLESHTALCKLGEKHLEDHRVDLELRLDVLVATGKSTSAAWINVQHASCARTHRNGRQLLGHHRQLLGHAKTGHKRARAREARTTPCEAVHDIHFNSNGYDSCTACATRQLQDSRIRSSTIRPLICIITTPVEVHEWLPH